MNNTKTIFKSLLIMIVAISLFTVSCSKDEGGTKTPTTPTIQKISSADITTILKGLGDLKDKDGSTVILSFNNITPNAGNAEIANADNTKEGQEYKVVAALKNTFTTTSFQNEKIELTKDPTIPTPSGATDLSVDISFKAKSGFEFDAKIIGKTDTTYTYDETTKSVKLTLKIKPKAGSWA
ncbi:hypothetical protein EPJ74_09350 [Brachyspira aalborgi]|uniref:Uncharacterized protein n=1 Tax=Brachyspira aalborgi TaxID=29522 RepID=A0A5C8GBI9_9SPIR|nr:hypothetical protein [Brachyspira aalborgi]TXJ59311.1 hypothetical protein EPJ74_09350 [Brachyspira aalborgi]